MAKVAAVPSDSSESARAAPQGMPAFFARYQPLIDGALKRELDRSQRPPYNPLRYMMGWVDSDGNPTGSGGGKAVRPTLCLLACEAAGGDVTRALPAAVALEYVHNFSLIHDDVQDRDRFRRHRLTVWAVWGEPIALVSGNLMLKVADLAIQRLRENEVSEETCIEACNVMTADYLRMIEGQVLDVSYESRSSITIDEYLNMIERKTGALIEAASFLGALVGCDGAEDRAIAGGLRRVGYELGRIFQIRDDMLGTWGGPETGKPVGSDIRRKKKALPAVHAINEATGPARDELERIYGSDSIDDADVEQVLEIMGDLDTQDYCYRLATDRWQSARSVLRSLQLPVESAQEFQELGDYLLVRDS